MASTGLHTSNSGLDAITLADGRHLLAYNYRERGRNAPKNPKFNALGGARPDAADAGEDWGVRWPLNLSSSFDGVDWRMVLTLEDKPCPHGYAYPAIIQTRDGLVHITYTWNRERIKHVVLDPRKL